MDDMTSRVTFGGLEYISYVHDTNESVKISLIQDCAVQVFKATELAAPSSIPSWRGLCAKQH